MLDRIQKLGLTELDIQELSKFQSRDGFKLLKDKEFNQIDKFFRQFPVYSNLIPLLTDGNSNYWCVYIDNEMHGMICYCSHEEVSLEPRFRNTTSLLTAINKNTAAYDFHELPLNAFDFPSFEDTDSTYKYKDLVEKLKHNLAIEKDEDIRQQLAFSIIVLSSVEDIEANIYPLLADENMYIQERAIQILGFHKYKPAKEKLIALKKTAMPNGQTAIGIALKNMTQSN